MTNIAILGSGRVGTALATGLAGAGHTLTMGVRDPEAARAKWKGPEVAFAHMSEAARGAPVVFNATPGDGSVATLSALRAQLEGKVLVDVANATVRGPDGVPGGLLYSDGSLGEAIQGALPDTFVVKTLNTVLSPVMADPGVLSSLATVFLSGNDQKAKATVQGLLRDLGWPEAAIEDLGGIDSARGVEALILLAPYAIRARGLSPFALTLVR